jgi:TusA-related sulfurtransferase
VQVLAAVGKGGRVEVVTDTFAAIETDIRAWCRTTGNPLVDVASDGETWQFTIENGPPHRSGHKLG